MMGMLQQIQSHRLHLRDIIQSSTWVYTVTRCHVACNEVQLRCDPNIGPFFVDATTPVLLRATQRCFRAYLTYTSVLRNHALNQHINLNLVHLRMVNQ